jgi:osmotically-inducible protein OsmY
MTSLIRYLTLCTLVLVAIAPLSACFPLVAGGAYMTGMVAVDRRTSGAMLEDQSIELKISSRISDALGERAHVNVTSYNRKVLLTGETPDPQDKERVSEIARNIDNISAVWNEVGATPISTLSERTSDAVISGRIKAELLDSKDLFTNAFKIVTERGTVYIMGLITPREAKRVSSLASGVTGVKKVVLVHESITDDELANIQPALSK